MADAQLRCLVTGATGYIGGRLVPLLLERGFAVRALARTPEKLAKTPWRADIEVARGDLGDESSLVTAFEDVDVVYYLVHSMGSVSDFAVHERQAAENVVTAARRAGVRRIVYLSGLHPEDGELSTHLASRTAVGAILMSSGIEAIVLQAGVVVGSGSASFEMIRHLTDRLPVMTTPKWVRNKIQPIAIGDVLNYLAAAAICQVPESRAWDIGGPDVLEYGDMMRIYAAVEGLRPRKILVLPVLTPKIAALWVGLVTPIPAGLARPLVESLHCDAVMDNNDIDTIIPPPRGGLTTYRDAVFLALHRVNRGEVAGHSGAEGNPNAAAAVSLPTDPQWAGEAVRTYTHSRYTSATPAMLWDAMLARVPKHWRIESSDTAKALTLRTDLRLPGECWLEVRITPEAGGTQCQQQLTFYPRGLLGRLCWIVGRPVWRIYLGGQLRRTIAAAD